MGRHVRQVLQIEGVENYLECEREIRNSLENP